MTAAILFAVAAGAYGLLIVIISAATVLHALRRRAAQTSSPLHPASRRLTDRVRTHAPGKK